MTRLFKSCRAAGLTAALAGMLAGFLTSVAWVLLFKAGTFGLYEAIPGFAAGFFATWAVSRLDRRRSGRGNDIA